MNVNFLGGGLVEAKMFKGNYMYILLFLKFQGEWIMHW
jgi:hypothetical protein